MSLSVSFDIITNNIKIEILNQQVISLFKLFSPLSCLGIHFYSIVDRS